MNLLALNTCLNLPLSPIYDSNVLVLQNWKYSSTQLTLHFKDFAEKDWHITLDLTTKKFTNDDILNIYVKIKELTLIIN